jgi:hypothetical protein
LVDWSIVCRVPAPLPIKATGTDQAADAGPDPVAEPVKELESIWTIIEEKEVALKDVLIWAFAVADMELDIRKFVTSVLKFSLGVAVYETPLSAS